VRPRVSLEHDLQFVQLAINSIQNVTKKLNLSLEEASIVKQREFNKYLPLEDWFRKQPATPGEIKLTFEEVEAILCLPLRPN
jgi:hypothetical protein